MAPDGIYEHIEGKSDALDTPGRRATVATDYRAAADADATNMLPGARYYLWFFRDPGPEGRAQMRTILMAGNSPVTDVFFGPDTPDLFTP